MPSETDKFLELLRAGVFSTAKTSRFVYLDDMQLMVQKIEESECFLNPLEFCSYKEGLGTVHRAYETSFNSLDKARVNWDCVKRGAAEILRYLEHNDLKRRRAYE